MPTDEFNDGKEILDRIRSRDRRGEDDKNKDRSLHMGSKMASQLDEYLCELRSEREHHMGRVQEIDLEMERVETMLKGFSELKAVETRRNPPDTQRRS